MNQEDFDILTKQNLKNSDNDGRAYSIMFGASEYSFPPFAVFCKMSSQQIGFLMSLPQFIGNTIQIITSIFLGQSSKRKEWIVFGVTSQAIALLPLAGASVFTDNISFGFLLLSFIIYFLCGTSIAPPWFAMMGDIIPESIRGTYLGKRNRMIGIYTFCATTLAGVLLFISKKLDYEKYGFALLFFIGFIARMTSSRFLNKMIDTGPINNNKDELKINFYQLIKNPANRNYLNFILFFTLTYLAVFIAGPYFSVYMLKELHYNYIEFTLANISVMVSQFLTVATWGKLSDKLGNRFIIISSGIGIIFVPFLWTISGALWFIISIQIFAGICWAGFSLCSTNYIFDSLTPKERTLGFSLLLFLIGLTYLGGASIGGIIADYIETTPEFFLKKIFGGYNLRPLFFISSVARLLVLIYFFKRFKELRIKTEIKLLDFFKNRYWQFLIK
ncbi:MAG: MFS transporter [Candidatus Hydrogenedentota bacterium]